MLKRNCLSAAQLCSQLLECFVKNQTKRSERRGVGRARERESARAFGSAPILAHIHSLTQSLCRLCLSSLPALSLSLCLRSLTANSRKQRSFGFAVRCSWLTYSTYSAMLLFLLPLPLPLSMLLFLCLLCCLSPCCCCCCFNYFLTCRCRFFCCCCCCFCC